jgi:uncharacterized DUF497 family protein
MDDTDAFEWDSIKAEANLRKHKISFQEARRVFDDFFVVIEQDVSEEYGENRFLAIGMIEGLLITVVYSERGERIRLISARRATSNERRKYHSGQTPS